MSVTANYIINEELLKLKDVIAANIVAQGLNASGKTAKSLEVVMGDNGGALMGRSFFAVLETGRKAGKVPKNFRQIIEKWATDKGLTFETPSKLRSFSYLVARKIAAEGTKQYRTGRRTDVFTDAVNETVTSIQNQLGSEVLKEIVTINDINEQYI